MRWAIGEATIVRSSASCATPQAGKPPLRYMGTSTYPSALFGAIRIGLGQASGSMTRDFYEQPQPQTSKTEGTSCRSTSLVRCLTRSKLLRQGYNTAREASVSKMRGRAELQRRARGRPRVRRHVVVARLKSRRQMALYECLRFIAPQPMCTA